MLFIKLFSMILLTIIFIFSISSSINADTNDLEIVLHVPDTLVSTGVDDGYISVYLDNFNYEIFGFQFVLISERPDLVTFDFSGAGFDTSGTLVSGFEYIEAIDKALNQSEYWFRCIADVSYIVGHRDGIYPQQGGVAVKIPYFTTNAPDTNLSFTSLLSIGLPTDFSDPYAYSIGAVPDTVVDTLYLNCEHWIEDSCANWVEVIDTSLGYDAIYYDSTVIGLLDSTIVQVNEGSITLQILNCDLDGSGDITISDLVCLVEYMFITGGEPVCPLLYCDNDLNGSIDISDLVYLIEYMFTSGPPPPDL